MKDFQFYCSTRIVYSEDLTRGFTTVKDILNAKKALVVTDPGLVKIPSFAELKQALTDAGLAYEVYSDVLPSPKDYTMDACAEVLIASGADIVVAFGGGSSIDTAKGAAIVRTNGGKLRDYFGVNTVPVEPMPVVAIPTTAGSGAEVSPFISVTDSQIHAKAQIAQNNIAPNIALLSPVVLKGSPRFVTTTAGFDAIGHSIESYINKKASVITEPISLKAFELTTRNLYKFVNDTYDTEAAEAMLLGSAMSVIAAGITGNTDVHCIGRSIGGTCDVNHGLSIAIILPHVINFYIDAVPEKLANCARAMGIDTTGLTDKEAAQQLVLALQKLREDLGMVDNFKELGMSLEHLDDMIKRTIWYTENGSDAGSAPRQANYDEYKQLYLDVYEGKKIVY